MLHAATTLSFYADSWPGPPGNRPGYQMPYRPFGVPRSLPEVIYPRSDIIITEPSVGQECCLGFRRPE